MTEQTTAQSYNGIGGELRINPCELTTFVTALANTLACRLDADELNLLSAVLVQLGDTLATIAAQQGICSNRK